MTQIVRHTRNPPAGVQKQWQRIFIPAEVMEAGDVTPDDLIVGISPVWGFDPDSQEDVVFSVHVPIDWIAGTDAYAYPVFCTNQNFYGVVRWGIQWTAFTRGISIGSVPQVIEGNFQADGTGVTIPPKSEWLTLRGSAMVSGEPIFQQDDRDFTRYVHLNMRLYRAAASTFDNHPGNARLYGLAIMYQAWI